MALKAEHEPAALARGARPLGVGILGAGYIARYHLDAIRSIPGAHLVGICDLHLGRAEQLARAGAVAGVYTSLGEMLERASPDVVHVLLPPPAHAEAIVQALDAGAHVFTEKPVCLDGEELARIRRASVRTGKHVGVDHNFLYSTAYERLAADVRSGRLGRIERVDVVWSNELPQLRMGPFDGWLFARPENVLFEVGPHAFAYTAHLVGEVRDLVVRAADRITLPGGRLFARCYEILASAGSAEVRLRLDFAAGYPEHFVAVRGTSATATADVEAGTHVRHEHTAQMVDLDRFLTQTRGAASAATQSAATLARFLAAKLGLKGGGTPYGRSISRCIQSFYAGLSGVAFDERSSLELAGRALALAASVARESALPATRPRECPSPRPRGPTPTVLVLGGTGFIGRALVKALCRDGHAVRLLARRPGNIPKELRSLGVDVAAGDLLDLASIERALDGVHHVYHLARGTGSTWEDFLATDVEPTRRLAESCAGRSLRGFYYASSIALYYAGRGAGTITEETAPHSGILRANAYARSKAENERNLLELHRTRGLPVVIFRPGIVLGPGGNPIHGGIAAWPFDSVSRLWGDGRSLLPIVLVDDCADAMARALDRSEALGQSFNLVGDASLTAQEYLDELERCSGWRVRRVPTSSMRYFAEELVKYAIKTLGRDPHRRRPSFAEWEGRTCRARFDASRARRVLGWKPTSSRERVVREGIELPAREFLA